MIFKNLISKNRGFTLIEMLVVLAVLAILLGLVSPNISLIAERANQAVGNLNAKIFRGNAVYDLALNNKSNIRISETVDLSTVGEVDDVVVNYSGTDTLKMLVSTDRGNSWHSYTINDQASLKDMFGGYAKAVNLRWELIDHSTPEVITDNALSIDDFNSLTKAEWLEILQNADVVTFAFNATDSEGNDITWDINPELSIVVTGADGTESVVFPENTGDTNAGSEDSGTDGDNTGDTGDTGGETGTGDPVDITLPADSTNLFADNTHKDNGDHVDNYDLVNAVTDNAANFSGMFNNADEFNKNLSGWNFANATDITDMITGSGLDQNNYNNLVDTIYNTNTQGWGISDIEGSIGDSLNNVSYTGDIVDYVSKEDASVIFGEDLSYFFENGIHKNNGDSVDNYNLANAYTGDALDMSSMFYMASSFDQDISAWDTSNVTNLGAMFRDADSFNKDIGNWDISNATSIGAIFADADSFDQDISNWDTSKVTNMNWVFRKASSFNQDLSNWDFSSATTIINTALDSGLDQANYNALVDAIYNTNTQGWTISHIEEEIGTPLSGVSYVENYSGGEENTTLFSDGVEGINLFYNNTHRFNKDYVHNYDLVSADTSNMTAMNGMFYYADEFNQDISGWDTSNVTNMNVMFKYADIFNQDIGNWNTSNVETMNNMFYNADAFNQDISGWNTSKVTDMANLFGSADHFNQDISDWDFSSVDTMKYIIFGTSMSKDNYGKLILKLYIHAINGELKPGLDLHGCNKRYVSGKDEDEYYIAEPTGGISKKTYPKFNGTPAEGITPYEARQYLIYEYNLNIPLEPREIANYNTNHGYNNGFSPPKFTLPEDSSFFFEENTHELYHLDLNHMDTSNVTDMSYMFYQKGSFDYGNNSYIPIPNNLNEWDTSNVVNMRNMFDDAFFNKDISDWNTSNVTSMQNMFRNNDIFNQDLSSWDFSGLDQSSTLSITRMIQSTNMSETNIDKLVAAIVRDTSFTETEVRDVIR